MAENTGIEWAHHTFNPWIGCTKVSPGCDHCYAETLATNRLKVGWGPHGLRKACGVRLAEAGCTAHEIMAVLGHRTLSEAQRYTAEADRRRMAESAMGKVARLATRHGTSRNPG